MASNNKRPKTIQSAGTVFDILEFIAEHQTAGVTEIAQHLDYSKSTIHYYLKTLEQNRYVVNDNGRYRIGLRLADLGSNALQQHALGKIVDEPVEELAEETNTTACVAVEEAGKAIFLSVADGGDARSEEHRVGQEKHIHCTAYGKAILAHLPSVELDRILSRHALPKHTEHTITHRDPLEANLERVRELGIAFAKEEHTDGFACIAAPIFDSENDVAGSIGVTGSVDRITDPRRHIKARRHSGEMHELVQRTARIVSSKLQ